MSSLQPIRLSGNHCPYWISTKVNRIIESYILEKASKIIKSNHKHGIAKSTTKPYLSVTATCLLNTFKDSDSTTSLENLSYP